jgi:hypothetical protein
VERGPLSAEGALAHSADAAYVNDGVLRAVYVSTAVTASDDTVKLDNGQSIVVRGVPHDGRSDLRIVEHALITDLALTSADVILDPARPRPGDTIVATIDVRNAGDFATGAFAVGIESRQNRPIVSLMVEAPFRGGEHRVVTLPFVYVGGPLVVVVDPANVIREADESNNRVTVVPARRRSVRH